MELEQLFAARGKVTYDIEMLQQQLRQINNEIAKGIEFSRQQQAKEEVVKEKPVVTQKNKKE